MGLNFLCKLSYNKTDDRQYSEFSQSSVVLYSCQRTTMLVSVITLTVPLLEEVLAVATNSPLSRISPERK